MLYPLSILGIILLALIHLIHGSKYTPMEVKDEVTFETRAYWMRKANAALAELHSPCPFAAFGTVIVNHTATSEEYPHGKMICIGVNQNQQTGNPTLHGEISGINNCSAVLSDPNGEYKLSPLEISKAWRFLSLYTNAEPCPMCASAIRWSGFAECIYGTSIDALVEKGWNQISLTSEDVFEESTGLPSKTRLIGGMLSNETDPYFSWQFDGTYPCPSGCSRNDNGKKCEPSSESGRKSEL
ncbi:cytidine deaminase-like protein [Tricladium varicosporioides]|nr:cytidine deaminase-like protein [Hymenoscyphus varicosporioides]